VSYKYIKLYTGKDYELTIQASKSEHEKDEIVTQRELKKNDFNNVTNAWNNIKVLIYTSCLTCGVDFSVEKTNSFDTFIHVYTGKSASPD